jgi:hypothetical protein
VSIAKYLPTFRSMLPSSYKKQSNKYLLHPNFVLCPSCVPEKVGLNKNDISIRNRGDSVTEDSQPRRVQPKTRVRKLRSSVHGQGALATERRKTDGPKSSMGVLDSITYRHGTRFGQITESAYGIQQTVLKRSSIKVLPEVCGWRLGSDQVSQPYEQERELSYF